MSARPIPFQKKPERPLFAAEDHVRAAAELAAAADSLVDVGPEHLNRDALLGLTRIISLIADHTRAVRDAWDAEYERGQA
jgi:hypothetical protein